MSEIGQRPPPYIKAEFESSELKHRAESELLIKLGAKEEEVNIAVYRYMNFSSNKVIEQEFYFMGLILLSTSSTKYIEIH